MMGVKNLYYIFLSFFHFFQAGKTEDRRDTANDKAGMGA